MKQETGKSNELRCAVCHAKQWERIDATHFRCGNCGTEITMVQISVVGKGESK